ncbi:MAG: bifunctional precorrin-2 dehydrogenase/sirohydrochlorin ferrochelatase [Flavobacteriaceae bacterium]|nr:bifunctional precorrin-2 dehydrogenase/sirohydrochlorin ferrochelatase [Flavobacteriaceae bacterium]
MNQNELYPVFLKVHQLNVLLVGGGQVAHEKLHFMLKSSPNAQVAVFATSFCDEIKVLAEQHKVPLVYRPYGENLMHKKDLVIGATNDPEVNKEIYRDAKQRQILVNIADTPELCDFYLGGIVTKGQVKIAISTNGKSPTTAKRLRQFLEGIIPENISDLVSNLNRYRDKIKGNFEHKVSTLNKITQTLISE